MTTPNRYSEEDEVWPDDITTGIGEFYVIHSITHSDDPHPVCTTKCYCTKEKIDFTPWNQ